MERQKQGRAPAYRLIRLAEEPAMLEPATRWFHEKWGVPEEEYRRSMAACLEAAGPAPGGIWRWTGRGSAGRA